MAGAHFRTALLRATRMYDTMSYDDEMCPRSRARRPAKKNSRGHRRPATTAEPGPPSRYTAPRRAFRIRPRWHKAIGAVLVTGGVTLVVLNYVDYSGANLLPGGHQDGYFILGAMIALLSAWWFGLFDRPS